METGKIVFGEGFRDFRRYFVGFEDQVNRMSKLRDSINASSSTYPPYNIIQQDNYNYVIEMVVAGLADDEIVITLEESALQVKGRKMTVDSCNYVHQGIAARDFVKSFILNDQVVVNGADIVNGILRIELERIVPESKKPRKIPISKPQLLSE